MPKINNTTTPEGYEIGGPIDVISTQEELQRLWQKFEANFPKQERNEPCLGKKGLVWYTTNGKSRRTRTIKLFEKMSMELGSLAGDVRAASTIGGGGAQKKKKKATTRKSSAQVDPKPKRNPNRFEVREPGMVRYWEGKTLAMAKKYLKQAHQNGLTKARILKDGEWL